MKPDVDTNTHKRPVIYWVLVTLAVGLVTLAAVQGVLRTHFGIDLDLISTRAAALGAILFSAAAVLVVRRK